MGKSNYQSLSNGCLMRLTPLAVYCYNMSKEDMQTAVRLQTFLTHSNPQAINACYLYCFAIAQLIKTNDPKKAYELSLEEAM